MRLPRNPLRAPGRLARYRWRAALVGALIAFPVAVPTPVSAAMPGPSYFYQAFLDDSSFQNPPAPQRVQWLNRAYGLGATTVRLNVYWGSIAPKRLTAGFDPSNPGDPGYAWFILDGAIRNATARGLKVVLTFLDAPTWAQGPGRPGNAPPGSWRPNPSSLGAFARAVAERYSGRFPDPLHYGTTLPRVGFFQAWDEPNLPVYLTPQWSRVRRAYVPASPAIYRRMLNAVYAAVKAVQPDAYVLSAGTAPYGDPPGVGLGRMTPVLFTRELLCLHGPELRREPCPDPAHFDALDHHPYSSTPTLPARVPGDVSVPDLGKLGHILHVAERIGRALPAGPKPIWITEIAWGTRPPNPTGVSFALQARYLALAFFTLWRQGVSHVFWFTLRDRTHGTSGAGLYSQDGRPKPAAAAFRFPFVAVPGSRGVLTLWGHAPTAGVVTIERKSGGAWDAIATLKTTPGGVFFANRRLGSNLLLKAREATVTSPAWATG